MPIIDADGYFGGDRFDMVSDSARLVWPSFFLASNTVARIELNYYKVIAKAFYKFKKKPTEVQFWAWVQEYQAAYLLFVYETEDGQPWGQWDTSEKFLVTYKLAADLRSPAPTARDFLDWKNEYIAAKKAKSIVPANFRNISKGSKSFQVCSDGNGGGNGNGVGGGKEDAPQAPPTAPPPAPIEIGNPKRGTRFSLRPLNPDWAQWAMKKRGWDATKTQDVYDSFTDYWIAEPGSDGIKLDWIATWRNWVKNERSRDGPGGRDATLPMFSPREAARRAELMKD